MIHPVIGNKRYLLIYFIIWAIETLAHSLLLYFYYDLPAYVAVLDGVVYNGIYLLLGIGIWYIVNYNPFELKNLINLILAHFLSALFIMGLWMSVAGLITGILFGDVKLSEPYSELVPVRIILGIMFYLLIAMVYYLMIYYQNFRERIEYEANIEAKYKDAELNTLKAQINPHFIFNSLNSISSLTISNPDIAQEMIVKLSEFFRMTLKKDNTQFALLEEEIKYSRLYFEIEKIRFQEKLKYVIDCDEKYKTLRIPHLILQPLLENAIKHGVQESINEVEVKLKCKKEEQFLVLILSNEFDPDSNLKGYGIGHKNIRERLRLIYNRNDLLDIQIIDKQYTAILKIPLS
jgi:signal transduction histidine kinase